MAERWLASQAQGGSARYPRASQQSQESLLVDMTAEEKRTPPGNRRTANRRPMVPSIMLDASPERSSVFRTGQERLYEAYNDLHSLAQDFEKPFDAPAILVVGHQTDGKSGMTRDHEDAMLIMLVASMKALAVLTSIGRCSLGGGLDGLSVQSCRWGHKNAAANHIAHGLQFCLCSAQLLSGHRRLWRAGGYAGRASSMHAYPSSHCCWSGAVTGQMRAWISAKGHDCRITLRVKISDWRESSSFGQRRLLSRLNTNSAQI